MALVREFIYEKATTNTYRFKEVKDPAGPMCGVIYVQQYIFEDTPSKIRVTIEEVK